MPTGVAKAKPTRTRVRAANTSSETALIWTGWNEDYFATSTCGSCADITWTGWNEDYTVSRVIRGSTNVPTVSFHDAATTSTVVWTHWNRHRTPAQLQAERDRVIQIEGEKAKARERAERLLREHLSDQQKEMLAEKGYFELTVLSQNGERRRYRINRQWSQNIQQIDPGSGRRLKTLCIHPRVATPVEDSMLAQKLMLESGMEAELLRIANHS
jgi:hypothetical protein